MTKKKVFLSQITNNVKDCWVKYEILPSVIIAQAILESGWGTSQLAVKANNLFGIKADKGWKGARCKLPTIEYVKGRPITVDALWRKYDCWAESIINHSQFLNENPRYQAIVGNKDYQDVCVELQHAGYATDPLYASKLVATIKANNLTKYDEVDALQFSGPTLKTKVESFMKDKKAQKQIIEKGIAAGACNATWMDKFNNGKLAEHDVIGLCVLYAQVK